MARLIFAFRVHYSRPQSRRTQGVQMGLSWRGQQSPFPTPLDFEWKQNLLRQKILNYILGPRQIFEIPTVLQTYKQADRRRVGDFIILEQYDLKLQSLW